MYVETQFSRVIYVSLHQKLCKVSQVYITSHLLSLSSVLGFHLSCIFFTGAQRGLSRLYSFTLFFCATILFVHHFPSFAFRRWWFIAHSDHFKQYSLYTNHKLLYSWGNVFTLYVSSKASHAALILHHVIISTFFFKLPVVSPLTYSKTFVGTFMSHSNNTALLSWLLLLPYALGEGGHP